MSQNNLELMKWGDESIHLTFWDSVNGDDVCFVLTKTGAYIEDDADKQTPCDLTAELIKLAERFDAEATAEIDAMTEQEDNDDS